jgi:hypothetical protein
MYTLFSMCITERQISKFIFDDVWKDFIGILPREKSITAVGQST